MSLFLNFFCSFSIFLVCFRVRRFFFPNSFILLRLHVFKFCYEKLNSWHTNFQCTFIINFKSLSNFFGTGECINDYENIIFNCIINCIKGKRVSKHLFVFYYCPILFRLHNFNVVLSHNHWRSPSFYVWFPSLNVHLLEKDNHTSLPIIIVCIINNWWSIHKSSHFSIVHFEHNVEKLGAYPTKTCYLYWC